MILYRYSKENFCLSHSRELKGLYSYSPHCSLYISLRPDKENLFNDQELLQPVIIFFILATQLFDLGRKYCRNKLDAGHS